MSQPWYMMLHSWIRKLIGMSFPPSMGLYGDRTSGWGSPDPDAELRPNPLFGEPKISLSWQTWATKMDLVTEDWLHEFGCMENRPIIGYCR